MNDKDYLQQPFFDDKHRQLEAGLDAQATKHIAHDHGPDVGAECRALVKSFGQTGWLHHAVGDTAHGDTTETIDTRVICLIRGVLTHHLGLADFTFAMQRLGSSVISLHDTPEQRERYLTRITRGEAIAAFVLSEPETGSDVATMACAARKDDTNYVLGGEKTWISSGGIADFYIVFVRPGEAPDLRGINAFVAEAGTPGFEIAERINAIAPRPLARLRFTNYRIPASQRVDAVGEDFKVTMRTLDMFRTSVVAATLGFACRALDEALTRATTRKMFSGVLASLQLTRAKFAQMTTAIDSAALLAYRAAWQRDRGRNVTRKAAMAKLAATEDAQQVTDAAVQIWDGPDVMGEQSVERLYREIRSLRIYGGMTEV